MAQIEIKGLSFSYPGESTPSLSNFNLTIEKGELFLLCGESGSGKTTLMRHLKPSLTPAGVRCGQILLNGSPIEQLNGREETSLVGFVRQNTENQIVTDKVWHELSFGLESLGHTNGEIRRKVAEMATFLGIDEWFRKNTNELSGGQKQLLNLASVMVMQPEILILDEPTGQLDPISAATFIETVIKLNRELGTTIIVSEHRLEEVFSAASRIAVMEDGRIFTVGTPENVGSSLSDRTHSFFYSLPTPVRVWAAADRRQIMSAPANQSTEDRLTVAGRIYDSHLTADQLISDRKNDEKCPVSVMEGRRWLSSYTESHNVFQPVKQKRNTNGEEVLKMEAVSFRYEQSQPDIVKNVDLSFKRGEFAAILGGNGAGKSTLLKLAAGIEKPDCGFIHSGGKTVLLPQDPCSLFACDTVESELDEMTEDKNEKDKIISLCRLDKLLKHHPYDLSGGEQQRTALAKVILSKPDILLMDEPTKGLDGCFKRVLADIIDRLTTIGITVIIVSHDMEFCASHAHRCLLFFDGGVAADSAPEDFFGGNRYYTTSAHRMSREIIPDIYTCEDLIFACSGGYLPPPEEEISESLPLSPNTKGENQSANKIKTKPSRSALFSAISVFLLIPLTLFWGTAFLGDRKYAITSFLILMEAILPFFILFEGRRPKARELVTIAVLCAISIAGRAVFFMLPQFKPMLAMAIISGAALGSETGFLVGAVSMLASNVMFSQGPWTPWQMFGMGIIGFIAGVLVKCRILKKKRLPLTVFGIITAFSVYGILMNTASALMWSGSVNFSIILTYCISGLPMDAVHALSTAIFLWFGAEPMLKKLDRIKIKYQLLE